MVGIHWYGYGNWEKIRLDPKLGLATKIAPATLGERAPNLDNRASALLQKVLTHLHLFLSYNLVWIFIVSQVTVMQIKMEILNAS
jgi:hypothetical protein